VAAAAPPGAERCVVAARVYLDGLVPAQRQRAVAPFDSDARRHPVFPPGRSPAKSGLRTGELTDGQRIRLQDFLSCGLSSQGYQKVLAIMRRGDLVRETLAKVPPAEREIAAETGPAFYWTTVFGEPSSAGPWGWRLEGHHLALDFTVRAGVLELSSVYLGADPAVITQGTWAGYRVLDTEFARGLELLESLTPEQRKRAVVSPQLPAGLQNVPGTASPSKPEGLPAAALDERQRELLLRLIAEYVGNAEPGTARRVLARLDGQSLETLHFAWRGPAVRGQPVYYRVQGPALTIEFLHAAKSDAAKGPPDINHIHTWWQLPATRSGG
jgi:hypothetical protein